jgi:hypothetical protein
MHMKTFLTITAIIEAGAGLALLVVPSLTASLLLGTPLDSPAAVSLVRRRRGDTGAGCHLLAGAPRCAPPRVARPGRRDAVL